MSTKGQHVRTMHIHILGICGTFMGGLALLARQLGHRVTGSDANVYPPMSTQLEQQGIDLIQGFDPVQLSPKPDLVVIGNAMSRGNPCVEAVLDQGIPYTSGPQFLSDHLLKDKWVLAVAGTHGKTTTSSMLAWLLEDNGLNPSFLIGGVVREFGVSARMTDDPFFVVEADEYDSAFFDKRSKFVHYRPRTLVINNLEYDHADIFDSLADIQKQFHHLLRMVPSSGLVLHPNCESIAQTLAMGCWSQQQALASSDGWQAVKLKADGSAFSVLFEGEHCGDVHWQLIGDHNVDNALAAIAAARHVGVRPQDAVVSLARFQGPKRRMELKAEIGKVRVYDDFAHHPTAIATTLEGLRNRVGTSARIIAILEPRSNTMKRGVHQDTLAASLQQADCAYVLQSEQVQWDVAAHLENDVTDTEVLPSVDQIIERVMVKLQPDDQIVIMSNGGFDGIHQRLIERLRG